MMLATCVRVSGNVTEAGVCRLVAATKDSLRYASPQSASMVPAWSLGGFRAGSSRLRARTVVACGLGVAVFCFAFWAAREVRLRMSAPAPPELVGAAEVTDGLPFVTANQALAATRRDGNITPIFVDVRTSTEFEAKHIPGAFNIQDFQIPDMLATLPAGRAWVVYCTCPDDHLAKWAVAAVQSAGLSNAVVLDHGLGAWQAAGGPVAVPDGADPAVQQGCGCTLGADAYKLRAIDPRAGIAAPEPSDQ
jgi:rhodanese-related sulfurtransferase